MINIVEKKQTKIPGITSLYISFPYNADIVSTIKSNTPVANYDKKTRVWEVPTTSLSVLVDSLSLIDEIDLELLSTDVAENTSNIVHDTYKTKPFDYQLEGIEFGLSHDRWLLLDAPGLGKTLQIIYLAQNLRKTGLEHCFIICGVNTLKYNWKNEIERHSDLSVKILGERTNRKGKVGIGSVRDRVDDLNSKIDEFFVITNVETVRNPDIIKGINKGKNKFDMMVIDEVHKCKSPVSQQGKNLLKLVSSKYRIALTGTLLLNNPLDAYVPLKWIGEESATYSNFKYYFYTFGGDFHNQVVGYRYIDVLKEKLSSCSLRRTKDLLSLPSKTISHECIEMNDTQATFYQNVVAGLFDQVDKVNMSSTSILSLCSRLRQATECPSILTTENIESEKVNRAIDLTDQIISGGEKVVVFSTFKETLNVLNAKLKEFYPLLCTGDVSDADIFNNIQKFQNDDKYKVMLCTTAKMGTGVTLTAASHAIFISSPWTMADCQQCEDRIHRIGSKDHVFIHYLECRGTIDEKVAETVEDKGAISDFVVDDKISESSISRLKKYIVELMELS